MSISRSEVTRQFNRVKAAGWLPWFVDYANRIGTSTAHLLGIGSRETNLKNIRGDFRGGQYHGFGVMQVDIGTDPDYARNWTPDKVEPSIRRGSEILSSKIDQILNGQGKRLSVKGHAFIGKPVESDDVRRIATAAYNCGLWAYYHFSRGENVDSTTTGHDYSRDVYDRAIEFARLLDESEPGALAKEVELQGKYCRPEHAKLAQVTAAPRESTPLGDAMEDPTELARADYHNAPDGHRSGGIGGPAPDGPSTEKPVMASEAGPKNVTAAQTPADAPAVPVNTVVPAKESAVKRLVAALGLGGIGVSTFAGKIGGFFQNIDGGLIRIVIILGLGAVLVYLIGQFINGLFDRWTAYKLNILQGQSAQSKTANTIQFVPPEAGAKE